MNGFAEEPRASYSAHMGKAEFFAWLQTKEGGRYELKDGEIIVHAASTLRHAHVSGRFLIALATRLDPELWMVLSADFAIAIGEEIRYPDVVVGRMIDDPKAMSTASPIVAIEVLSPSSANRDMHEKLAEYTSLPSLQAYIVASQDQPIVWVWQRDTATGAFSDLPIEVEGAERSVEISALEISLPLGEIYRGIAGT